MRIRPTRRDVAAFGLTVIVGAATAAAITVSAAGGDGEATKQKPPRDAPGAVQVSDLPAGEHLAALSTRRIHGGLLILPPGDTQDLQRVLDALPVVKHTFERLTAGPADTSTVELPLDDSKLPAGYKVAVVGGLRRADDQGAQEIAEAGLTLEGPGYPIAVQRWIPPAALVGEPYAMGVWTDGEVMTTLGAVRTIPAVFVHRRPGVKTSELQQIFIADGKHVILVEGYVDDFKKLIAVAEALLIGSGRIK